MQSPVRFFFSNAGYSYDPARQTALQGRWECARRLAAAEAKAEASGVQYEWKQDDITSRSFTDEGPEYYLWECVCQSNDGQLLASLGGIDFGPGVEPWGELYARVVEAELAMEGF